MHSDDDNDGQWKLYRQGVDDVDEYLTCSSLGGPGCDNDYPDGMTHAVDSCSSTSDISTDGAGNCTNRLNCGGYYALDTATPVPNSDNLIEYDLLDMYGKHDVSNNRYIYVCTYPRAGGISSSKCIKAGP